MNNWRDMDHRVDRIISGNGECEVGRPGSGGAGRPGSSKQAGKITRPSKERLDTFYSDFGLEVDEAACREEYAVILQRKIPEKLSGKALWVHYTRTLFAEKLNNPHVVHGVAYAEMYRFCLRKIPSVSIWKEFALAFLQAACTGYTVKCNWDRGDEGVNCTVNNGIENTHWMGVSDFGDFEIQISDYAWL